MPLFRYQGAYPAYVGLPDGSTVHAHPGETLELASEDPGPTWQPVDTPEPDAAPNAARKPRKTTSNAPDLGGSE